MVVGGVGVRAGFRPSDYLSRAHSLNDDGVLLPGGTRVKLNDDNILKGDGGVDSLQGDGGLNWFWIKDQDSTDMTGQEKHSDDV